MTLYSDGNIEVMIGLDDIAHNRMYEQVGKKMVRVKNYGKRNFKEKCYCAILKELGVRR